MIDAAAALVVIACVGYFLFGYWLAAWILKGKHWDD